MDSGEIKGENSIVKDFEDWYYQIYGKKVVVEYSTVGTNEELYNMLTLGDEYDLICPSEYMIMKLMAEGWLEPFSEQFFDKNVTENYYTRGVSPFIRSTFDENTINGEAWSRYAAGYMWGITGIVYNPEEVTEEEASTWKIISNDKFKRQITIKDNVQVYKPTKVADNVLKACAGGDDSAYITIDNKLYMTGRSLYGQSGIDPVTYIIKEPATWLQTPIHHRAAA